MKDVHPSSGLRKMMPVPVHGFSPVAIIGEAPQASTVHPYYQFSINHNRKLKGKHYRDLGMKGGHFPAIDEAHR